MIIQKQNGDLKENNDVLRKQRGDALSQLNTLVEEKKALELDLYQKVFICSLANVKCLIPPG